MLFSAEDFFKKSYFSLANLITLSRLLVMITIIPFFLTQPLFFLLGCIFVELLDPLDGYVARVTGRASQLGKVLDMTVDRLFIFMACTLISVIYPRACLVFMVIGFIDIASHYVVIYSCAPLKLLNHKHLFKNSHNILLRKYYSGQRLFMFLLCLAYDLSFLFLYLYHFYPCLVLVVCTIITVCLGSIKIIIHLLQMGVSLNAIAKLDNIE